MFHNSKTCLVYPLALRTNNVQSKCQTLFHNSKITRSVCPSALPLPPKVGFLYQSTSPHATLHATLHAEIYLPIFKTLTGSTNFSEYRKETNRKSTKRVQRTLYNCSKVYNLVSGHFCSCSTSPLWGFAPGHPPSTIMQFRRIVYEYSMKKLRLSLHYAK